MPLTSENTVNTVAPKPRIRVGRPRTIGYPNTSAKPVHVGYALTIVHLVSASSVE